MEHYQDLKKAEKGAWLSIVAYLFLSLTKIFIGLATQSAALYADGLNNATDIVASLAVLIGLKISQKPPDKNHPYGHFRAETISALIASFIMMVIGLEVLRSAILSLYHQDGVVPNILAAWVALSSGIVMFVIYRYNYTLAKKINNQALMAAAKDNRSDALVSIGAFIGIIGAQFGFPWLDTVTAIIVGLIICKTAIDIFRETSNSLTDGFDDVEHLNAYKRTIQGIQGVQEIKDLRARRHGNQILLDVIIQVNPHMNVKQSHDITLLIEREMRKKHKIHYVHIHIEPLDISQ